MSNFVFKAKQTNFLLFRRWDLTVALLVCLLSPVLMWVLLPPSQNPLVFWEKPLTESPLAKAPLIVVQTLNDQLANRKDHQPSVAMSAFDKEAILNDYDNRISDVFSVPEGLRDRVAFWFDVYTKYHSNQRVIHHSRYPWIVFKVVDLTEIMNRPGRRMVNALNAERLVKRETAQIENTLARLSRKKNFDKLTPNEQTLIDSLASIKGKRSSIFSDASRSVRIQTGQKDYFEQGLLASAPYMQHMEEIMASQGLPPEIANLPLVESSFNRMATSKAGAAGVWQFIGKTGRKFMMVGTHIDERRSPFKSTEAAAKLLKENYIILKKSWPLALTAYNHGPGGTRRAVHKTGTTDISRIIATYRTKNFSFATVNYYTEFLAAVHASHYHKEVYGDLPLEPALEFDIVRLPEQTRPANLMKLTGLDDEALEHFNPDLRKAIQKNAPIPRGFRLLLPPGMKAQIEAHFAAVPRAKAKKQS